MSLRPSIAAVPLLVLVTLALVTLGTPVAARAAGPTIRVLPYQPLSRQATPELCAQITDKLQDELSAVEGVSVARGAAEGADTNADADQAARDRALQDAKAALDKALARADGGSKLVKKQRFDPAIKALEEAVHQFDNAAPVLTDAAPVVQAHVDLAVALWKRGREDESQTHMQAAARLDADYKPDPKEYWPLFLRVYDQQWRKALREPRGKVRVDATVPGAEVFFDGKSVGAVPLQLTNVVPGRHFLRVVKDGAGAFGATLTVDPNGATEVTADLGGSNAAAGGLGPVAKAINANLVDEAALGAARALGKASGADYVFFGGVKKGDSSITVATFLVATATGKAGRLVDLEFDLDLLNLSVESFKLTEEFSARVVDFGATLQPGATPILRGVAGADGESVTEVDVGPAMPDAQGKPQDQKRMVEGGDEEGGTRAIGGSDEETKKNKMTSRYKRGTQGGKDEPQVYEPKKPWFLALPLVAGPVGLIAVAVVGVVAVAVVLGLLGVGGAAGGVAAYYFLAPAQSATVKSTWPK